MRVARSAVSPEGATRGERGFTLVELLGVLSVVILLATLVTVGIVERLKAASRDAERISLTTLAESLSTQILRSKAIPGTNTWSQELAGLLGLPSEKVRVNSAGRARLLLYDPAFRVGTNAGAAPPFVQSASGSIAPVNARVVLVSSLGEALPSVNLTATTFSNLWNTTSNSLPADWVGSWPGRAEDLLIARFDLGRLFRRVILENLDIFQAAPFSVETTNTLVTIPAGQRREMWVIDTTALNFHFGTGQLQAREFVGEDAGYTYEDGAWRRFLRYGRGGSIGWFGDMVDLFLAADPPPGTTRRYSNQQWVIDAMYQFLYNYGQWSLDDFDGGSPWPHIPGYELSASGSSCLINFSSDLLNYY